MDGAGDRELLERLASVAQELDTGFVHETLQRAVDLAVETVPGCRHAGISLVHGRKIATPAASDFVALRLDAIQAEVDEGPCLDAIGSSEVFGTDDLAQERRWPAFSERAVRETGIHSILALRLLTRGRALGAMNLLSEDVAAFGEDSLAFGALFAAVTSVALHAAESEQGLQAALESRDVIGQAKGILMERHKITSDDAFRRLVDASQGLNVKVREVAQRLTVTGEDPGAAIA